MRRVDYIVGTRGFKDLRADQFMQDQVFSYHVDDKAETLAEIMTEEGFGSVPVVDSSNRVIGIVSEFDLLKALMDDKPLAQVTAGELMTRTPITVTLDTAAMDIIRLLEEKHLIRMPVVDRDGRLVGIVARRDVLKGYLNATRPTKVF